VYLAENPASALLEVCVHTSANDVPPSFTLLRIEGPDGLAMPSVLMKDLPEDWATRPEVTQERGTAWLQGRESVLLRVPSAIVPETSNILFNPAHEQASAFRITDTFAYPFDPRLKR
jgi:RES domain-containing protein